MAAKVKRIFSNDWLKYFVAALIPIIGCLLFLLYNHMGIGEYTVYFTRWNDELSYYKHTEGILKYGLPKGYFGFNESTALKGTFGAWNPTCLIPFLAVGKVFGWTGRVPIIFNLVIWVLAFIAYVKITNPKWSQLVVTGALYLAFICNHRYIYSVTPEPYITVLLLIFFCIFIRGYNSKFKVSDYIILDLIIIFLTTVRGYYAVLGVLVIWSIIKKDKKVINFLIQCIVTLGSAVGFLLIKRNYTAPYFEEIVNTSDLKNPVVIINLLVSGVKESISYIIQCLQRTSMRGSWYLIYYLIGMALIYLWIKKKDSIYAVTFIAWLAILASMFTIYNPKEGSRHLMALAFVGAVIINQLIQQKLVAAVSVILLIYCSWLSTDTFYMKLENYGKDWADSLIQEQQELEQLMPATDDRWDSTAILTLSMVFNDMYALPAGYGIQDCDDSYVMEHIDELQSKYVVVRIGEEIETFLADRGYEVIDSYSNSRIYKLR